MHYYTKTPKINNGQPVQSSVTSNYSSAKFNFFIQHFETEASFKQWAGLPASPILILVIYSWENRKHGYEDWGLVNEYSANNATTYLSPTSNYNVNLQKNSGYSQFDVLQKIVINLPKESQLLFNLQFSNSSDIPRFDKLNEYRNGSRFGDGSMAHKKITTLSPT